MSLPDLAPVLAVGAPAALVGVCLRYGSDAIVKVVMALAVLHIRDEKHRQSCLEALRILRRSNGPPEPPQRPGPE